MGREAIHRQRCASDDKKLMRGSTEDKVSRKQTSNGGKELGRGHIRCQGQMCTFHFIHLLSPCLQAFHFDFRSS